jgi:hypothetical protein
MAIETEELLVHFGKNWWKPGARLKYHDMAPNREASYLDVHPGLYWYSGLGSGTFFRTDGTMLGNCSPQEAHAEARRLGIEMRYVDSFVNTGRATFVGY